LEQKKDIENVIGNFSIFLKNFPLGNRANNIEIAITGYRIILTIFTQTDFPVEWATTNNNLAVAYSDRIRGDKAENVEKAIECCQNALVRNAEGREVV
jgi:hypothetical protein